MATCKAKSWESAASDWRSKTLLGPSTLAAPDPDTQSDREHLVPFRLVAFELFSPETIAWRVRQLVLDQAQAKCVDVEIRCSSGPVWVQPHSFSAALYALVHNAVRASRNGHPVILDVHEMGQGDVIWQVQDMGQGMVAGELTALGRVPPEGLRPRLGVPFAWAVIEAHGGLLHFESAVGVGTTATIWLAGSSRTQTWAQE